MAHHNLPKIDLHLHLDGSMLPETAWDLAKQRGIKLPADWEGRKLGSVALPEGRRAIGLERKGRLMAAEPGLVLAGGDVLILRRRQGMEAQS